MTWYQEDPQILEWIQEIANLAKGGPGCFLIDPTSHPERAVFKEMVRSYLVMTTERDRYREMAASFEKHFILTQDQLSKSERHVRYLLDELIEKSSNDGR